MSDGPDLHDNNPPGEVRRLPAREAHGARGWKGVLLVAVLAVGAVWAIPRVLDDNQQPQGVLPPGPGQWDSSKLDLPAEQFEQLVKLWQAADQVVRITPDVGLMAPKYGDEAAVAWATITLGDVDRNVKDRAAGLLERAREDGYRPPQKELPSRLQTYGPDTAEGATRYVAELWVEMGGAAASLVNSDVPDVRQLARDVQKAAPEGQHRALETYDALVADSPPPAVQVDLSDVEKVQKIGELAAQIERASNPPPGYGIEGAEVELDLSHHEARELRRAADAVRGVTVDAPPPTLPDGGTSAIGPIVYNGWETLAVLGAQAAASSDPDIKAFGERATAAAARVLPDLRNARDTGVLPVAMAAAPTGVTSAASHRAPADRATTAVAPAAAGSVRVGSDGTITILGKVVNEGLSVGAKADTGKYAGVVHLRRA